MKTTPLRLPVNPSPYEYALISQLAYHSDLANPVPLPAECHDAYQFLSSHGWRVETDIEENGYHASIWVNAITKQVVLAHRGSQNADSWLTDLESVIHLRPGSFVHSAVASLSHSRVLALREQGYRFSTTGHSLGGFLAQICVFWSQRHELEQTYYPDMSAVVFDSPGAVEFLNALSSNNISQKENIIISQLNIQNFCAMPTVVSTFGTSTGTIWHLSGAEQIRFGFVMDHLMGNIVLGLNPETGQPYHFRQMIDWPQVDYSPYQNLTSAVEHIKIEAVKLPFKFLNTLYKRYIKSQPTDTWLDKILGETNTIIGHLQRDPRPTEEVLQDLEQRLNLAMRDHYSTYSSEQISQRRIKIAHFDRQVQNFLNDLILGREETVGTLGWNNDLKMLYGEEGNRLLSQFHIESIGNTREIVLSSDYLGTIFDFQRELLSLLARYGIPSFSVYLGETYDALNQKLNNASTREEMEQLRHDIAHIVETFQSQLIIRTATAEVPGTHAVRLLDEDDYKNMDLAKILELCNGIKPGVSVFIDSARAMAPQTNSTVVSPGVKPELARLFAPSSNSQPPCSSSSYTQSVPTFFSSGAGVSYVQIRDIFRVNLDYSALGLSIHQRELLQSLQLMLTGPSGTGSLDYIHGTVITKKEYIIQLDFDNQRAAEALVHNIKREVARLKQVAQSQNVASSSSSYLPSVEEATFGPK